MSKTARQLIREVGDLLGECILSTATSSGTATTIIDTSLRKFFPVDQAQDKWMPWVYAITGTAANIVAAATEQRGRQWSNGAATLTLCSPGYPSSTASTDTFEIHLRHRRARILAAINDAIGKLGLYWPRPVKDESLTTASDTWQYTLPSSVNWIKVTDVEIQVSDTSGYPYQSARSYDWRAEKTVSSAGTEAWKLQFVTAPPTSKTIRVWGEAYYSSLSADTDVLPLSGEWEGIALAWIYDWTIYRLDEELMERKPSQELDKYRIKRLERLNEARQEVLMNAPSRAPGKIIVPGRGTGQETWDSGNDSSWLGARRVSHA